MYDLAIIGGGPAGVSAGVYAARKRLKTVLITESFGGQSTDSPGIENWIGWKVIPGAAFGKLLEDHLRAYKGDAVEIKAGEKVVKVSKDGAMWKEETLSSDTTLYPGNSTVLKSEYTVPKGDYTAQIYVDNKNDIKELNEFNNVLETKATSRAMIIVQPARDTSDDSSSDDEEE